MKKFILIMLAATGLFASCSESNPDPNTNKTGVLMNYLISNNWYPDSAISGTSNVLIPCHLDDKHTFNANGKYEVFYGASRCFTGQPASSSASSQVFSVDEVNKTMFIHYFGEDIDCEIIQLDNNKLILKGHQTNNPGYFYYMSFKAI